MKHHSKRLSASPIILMIGLVSFFIATDLKTVVSQDGTADLKTWPGFRGAARDGRVANFPARPFRPRMLWSFALPSQGVGGVAASHDFVIVSARTDNDTKDYFACLDPTTGAELWTLVYPAPGSLDYGNSPRATPQVVDPYVYLLGAFGDLHCVNLDSGEIEWKKHLVRDMAGRLPNWGFGWSPLAHDEKLYVLPGGPSNSAACLAQNDGRVLWQSPGQVSAYSSPQIADWKGNRQLVAFDKESIVGWDAIDGKRRWSVTPTSKGDFNVPTPILLEDGLMTLSENNGARVYRIDDQGRLMADPVAIREKPAPDAQSPVRVGSLVISAERELTAMRLDTKLDTAWTVRDRSLRNHNSLIVGGNQMLVITQGGEILLVDVTDSAGTIRARHKFGSEAGYVLAHPALCDEVLYLRTEHSLQAWALWATE